MNKIKQIITTIPAFLPLIALGQVPGNLRPVGTVGVRDFGDILGIIFTVIGWGQALVFIIASIMIVYAAYLYVLHGSDEKERAKAKDILVYAAVGIGVALLAFAVRPVVEQLIGPARPQPSF